MNHASTRHAVAEAGVLRRSQDEDHTQDVQHRKRVDQATGVAQQASRQAGLRTGEADDAKSESPRPGRS